MFSTLRLNPKSTIGEVRKVPRLSAGIQKVGTLSKFQNYFLPFFLLNIIEKLFYIIIFEAMIIIILRDCKIESKGTWDLYYRILILDLCYLQTIMTVRISSLSLGTDFLLLDFLRYLTYTIDKLWDPFDANTRISPTFQPIQVGHFQHRKSIHIEKKILHYQW
jgi:hypothetical protein